MLSQSWNNDNWRKIYNLQISPGKKNCQAVRQAVQLRSILNKTSNFINSDYDSTAKFHKLHPEAPHWVLLNQIQMCYRQYLLGHKTMHILDKD